MSSGVHAGEISLATTFNDACFGVYHGLTSLSRLHKMRVLGAQLLEVALGIPDPGSVRSEEKIHFFQGALVRFRIKGPYHWYADSVANAKDVECDLVDGIEHDWAKESLRPSVSGGKSSVRYLQLTSHPLPMAQPTTPQALPFARTARGKISAGYNSGTVNHVAPKMAVKMKTMDAAAIP